MGAYWVVMTIYKNSTGFYNIYKVKPLFIIEFYKEP